MRLSFGSIRQWHWVSAAVTLIGMLLFAITGITLNHAGDIRAETQLTSIETEIPPALLKRLKELPEGSVMLPAELHQYVREQGVRVDQAQLGEWDGIEFYVAMPKPGVDAWLAIDSEFGELIYERSDRGWVAYFNDLHKGRDAGLVWFWFIDVFAIACVVFCVTGLVLLFRQGAHRPMTWPITALGGLLPLIILFVFV